ncbi:e3 ubiquitin-protein ligase ATL15 [Trichonephila inaurata madagascariensis]|uniref:E3 ubiquitin-protein ligase ATL15 n=1 Tax=Trichonephila inaurata madagascariensis TaxID=2747483 RepID=A0A8X7BSQ4_9ARAC|nr:e3 ubiquitin-protein ligase ATL15 [Trichonephila inaurata madagascariensis]
MGRTRKPSGGLVSSLSKDKENLPQPRRGCQSRAKLESTGKKNSKLDSTKKEIKCSVCLDTTRRRKMKTLSCKHQFHKKCIDEWLQTQWICPLCRHPLVLDGNETVVSGITAEGRRQHLNTLRQFLRPVEANEMHQLLALLRTMRPRYNLVR